MGNEVTPPATPPDVSAHKLCADLISNGKAAATSVAAARNSRLKDARLAADGLPKVESFLAKRLPRALASK